MNFNIFHLLQMIIKNTYVKTTSWKDLSGSPATVQTEQTALKAQGDWNWYTLVLLCRLLLPSHMSSRGTYYLKYMKAIGFLQLHLLIIAVESQDHRGGNGEWEKWRWMIHVFKRDHDLFSPGQIEFSWFLGAGPQGKESPRDFIKLLLLLCIQWI